MKGLPSVSGQWKVSKVSAIWQGGGHQGTVLNVSSFVFIKLHGQTSRYKYKKNAKL